MRVLQRGVRAGPEMVTCGLALRPGEPNLQLGGGTPSQDEPPWIDGACSRVDLNSNLVG